MFKMESVRFNVSFSTRSYFITNLQHNRQQSTFKSSLKIYIFQIFHLFVALHSRVAGLHVGLSHIGED